MIKVKLFTAVIALFSFFSTTANLKAAPISGESGEKDLQTEISEYISHHLLDTHYFDLFSYKSERGEKIHVSFSLPIIIWDQGFKFFLSSKFNHGSSVAQVGEDYYKLYHGKIYKTNSSGTINYDNEGNPKNIKPLDFSITKNVVFIFIVGLIMVFLFTSLAKGYQKNQLPKGLGRVLEPVILYVRDEIAKPNIGEKHYRRFMGHLLTIFFFVWVVNLFGLTPLGVNVTNNIAVTFALALITYLITTFSGNKNYWKHIFWMPGVPLPMKIILAPIELLGTIIKPFSLMIRLYANITAGHIVIMSIIGLMFLFKNWLGSSLSFSLAFLLGLLELLVAALQAYIFTMLSALYFGMAVEEHDEH